MLLVVLITGLVQVGVIQYSMKAAGIFDVLFVNTIGLPFFSGFAAYFIMVAALIYWVLNFNEKKTNQKKLMIWFALFLASHYCHLQLAQVEREPKLLNCYYWAGAGVAAGYFIKPAAIKNSKTEFVVLCIYDAWLFYLFHRHYSFQC